MYVCKQHFVCVCACIEIHVLCMCRAFVCIHYILIISFLQQMKSVVAARAIKHMNPAINVIAHQNRVGPETEGIL